MLELQIFHVFSPGRYQLLRRAGQRNIGRVSALCQPPYQLSTCLLDRRAGQLYLPWSIWLGQTSSINGNTSISI